jgi:hypothetical protein
MPMGTQASHSEIAIPAIRSDAASVTARARRGVPAEIGARLQVMRDAARELEGRARLTAAFIDFARARTPSPDTEPKLALAIAAYAAAHPIRVVETSGDIIDLGTVAASHPANAAAMTTVAPCAQHLGG